MMRLVVGLMIVLLIRSSTAFSQDVQFGVKAGPNFPRLHVDKQGGTVTSKTPTTFHIGLYATIMSSEKFGIQTELMFSQQGGDLDSANMSLSYLTLPVLARYNLLPWLSIHAGPQLGALLSAKDGSADIMSQFKSLDLSLASGVTFELPANFQVSLRYIHGLTNISAVDFSLIGIPGPDPVFTNRLFQISLGYTFSRSASSKQPGLGRTP